VKMEEGRKNFFFEKKKQKTFVLFCAGLLRQPRPKLTKSFLLLFFKKEVLASFLPPPAPLANHPHVTMLGADAEG